MQVPVALQHSEGESLTDAWTWPWQTQAGRHITDGLVRAKPRRHKSHPIVVLYGSSDFSLSLSARRFMIDIKKCVAAGPAPIGDYCSVNTLREIGGMTLKQENEDGETRGEVFKKERARLTLWVLKNPLRKDRDLSDSFKIFSWPVEQLRKSFFCVSKSSSSFHHSPRIVFPVGIEASKPLAYVRPITATLTYPYSNGQNSLISERIFENKTISI